MTYRPDENVKWIVVHYSSTPFERDVSVADIDAIHRKRGFKEIGYHLYIRKSGLVEKGRDLSQPGRFEQGAHSRGENDASIGVCFEGGVYESDLNKGMDTRTDAQKEAMVRVIRDLLKRYPNAKVVGHRDMPGAATQCPGFDAAAWWAEAGKEPRTSPMQSKTVKASATISAAGAGSAVSAVAALDDVAQYIVLGFAGIIILAALFILRERLKAWSAGWR